MKPERKEKKGKQPKPIRHLLNHQKHVVPLLNMALGVISFLANTASLFMIVSAIVEFGFQLTEKQVLELNWLYFWVWITFLLDRGSHLLLMRRGYLQS